jgi:tetratricopeptide (TPR) repeat protein
MTDVFDLQDEITAEMVKSLGLHFNQVQESVKQKVDPVAFNEMLLGRYHSYRMEYEPALVAYQKALVAQENYADVHAGLAQVYDVQENVATNRELREKADYHTQRALALDPLQPMASCIQLQRDYLAGELQPALDSFAELLKRGPNEYPVILFYESFLRCLRCEEESLRLLDRLVELDPLNSLTYFQKGESLRYFGHFDAARRAYEHAGALGMPVEGIIGVLALDMRDADLLEVQLSKPAESWGIIYHYHALLTICLHQIRNQTDQVEERIPGVIEAAKSGPYYARFIATLVQQDWLGAVEHLERGYREGEWLCFSYMLETAGIKANQPEFYRFPAYLEFLQSVGMDAESRSRLKVRPLPF